MYKIWLRNVYSTFLDETKAILLYLFYSHWICLCNFMVFYVITRREIEKEEEQK